MRYLLYSGLVMLAIILLRKRFRPMSTTTEEIREDFWADNITAVAWERLFVTGLFRNSRWVQAKCQAAGAMWVSSQKFPIGHFGSYFGLLGLRRYPNKYIQDLYYLHELVHWLSFRYNPLDSAANWMRRLSESEFEASLGSECLSYVYIPGLRAKTFEHEIWVDRFLKKWPYRLLPCRLLESFLRWRRMRVYTRPNVLDPLELQISAYVESTKRWLGIFVRPVGYGQFAERPAFRVIEEHMVGCTGSTWPEDHLDWLRHVTPALHEANNIVPFGVQADAFEKVFVEASNAFGNWMFNR
jgi:hypothetical protein